MNPPSGPSFDDLMNDWDNNTFFGQSHSLPSHLKLEYGNDQWHNDNVDGYTLDPSVFLDTNNIMTTQDLDLILSSDPTFMRQQHILQEQQKQPRSNLSAMLSVENTSSIRPINLITSQEQSQNILNRRLSNQTEPIPIATTSATVDHQRRFNELQARFRINNIKKPKQSSLPNTTDSDRRRLSLDPTSGSRPILKLNKTKPKQSLAVTPPAMSSSFPSRTMPIQIQRQPRPNSVDLESRQKKLDDQLLKVNFDDITVSELKEMLRQRGKPATGKKAVLVQRLQEEREKLPDIGSLIADMHIGSPPPNRRFSPYGTSPRSIVSSSMPTLKKSYAPFESSALATPDQEKDVNPFDLVKQEQDDATDIGHHSTEELLALLGNQGPTDGLMDFNDLQFDISDLTNVIYDNYMDTHPF